MMGQLLPTGTTTTTTTNNNSTMVAFYVKNDDSIQSISESWSETGLKQV